MIRFGSIECQEAAKATEAADRGDAESWKMCAHWMMDAHRREHLLLILSSHLYSVSPIQATTFTNMVSLQIGFMCSEVIITLIWVMLYRLQLLSVILQ